MYIDKNMAIPNIPLICWIFNKKTNLERFVRDNMALNDLITTKNASQFLNISASSLRVYAQTMELLGYDFKRRENARQFSQYDLHIISEAMKFFKLHGGTMKTALHYAIVKEEQGEEIANALPELQDDYSEENNKPKNLDISAFSDEIITQISHNLIKHIDEQSHKSTKNVIQALQELKTTKDDTYYLKEENDQLKGYIKQINEDKELYTKKYKKLEEKNEKLNFEIESLRKEISNIKKMSMWEFRKWKK